MRLCLFSKWRLKAGLVIMSSIIYALVARDGNNVPLVEAALAEGNFPQMALKLLTKVKLNASMSYTYENK